MKKGFEWSIYLMVAVILFTIAVLIFWSALQGESPPEAQPVEIEKKSCRSNVDCKNDLDGARCLVIYPETLEPFCGCLTNEDCENRRSGVCGPENKCI